MTINFIVLVSIVFVCVIVAVATTWIVISINYNNKIEKYKSIKVAIENSEKINNSLEIQKNELLNNLKNQKDALSVIENRTQELVKLEEKASEIRNLLENGQGQIDDINKQIIEIESSREKANNQLYKIKSEIDLYQRILDFIDYGIFEEPEYLYETSERYQVEIKKIRDMQKDLIKDNKAIELPNDILVDGSSKKGSSVLNGQAKMMIKSFNLECDYLLGKLTHSNFPKTLEQIEKVAEELEKLAISIMCGISDEYIKLKFEECKLFYQYKLRKKEEQEEQEFIREQMREEQKAIREYEQAIAQAEKEEKLYERLIEKTRLELSKASDSRKIELEAKISLLEEQLKDAQEKGKRAQSMAEQTKRGYVYVISNVGSFGEDVYKIGLTRRLEPIDRVNELSGASVPFKFDIHAMIYSEDAPALEAELHRKFNHKRINVINKRKEFFNVKLDEIEKESKNIIGNEVDFIKTILAEEYFESLRLLGGIRDANVNS